MLDDFFSILAGQWQAAGLFVLVALSCVVAAALVQSGYHWLLYCSLFRYDRRVRKGKVVFQEGRPSVSVIVCAKDEAENLERNLPEVLSQDYQDFEVIVVDDASGDETADVLTRLSSVYDNLRVRTVPAGAKFTSSKKFAVSLGIKAAKNDILLFTDADCRPASKLWISTMVRNFTPGVRIVLGYGAYESKKGLVSYAISYDTVTIAMQYLSCAVSGMPYMGVGRNLAYRKSFFLSTKGFSSHLDLQSGDDDLFVNEYADAGNTKVEISPLSVTVSAPKSTIWQWFVQKQRHLTTSVRYKPSSKAVLGCEMFSRALFYIAFAACMCTGNLIAVGIAGFLFIVRMVSHYVMVNKLSSVLGDRKFPCGLILLDIFIPFFNLAASLAPRKGERYKWK